MVRPGRERLTGLVEVDETYWGAEEEGVIGRQTERKALIAVAAEERGTGLGRIRMQRVQNASAASLMPFVEESVEPGSVVVTDNWSGYDPLKKKDYQRRIISINNRREQASQLLPRVHLAISYSSAGCWARIRGRSATSIWTTISTSSCSASIGADHAVGASSSTALCSRPWRWSRRRTARSSPIGTLRRCEPNYKMLGSPESSGYPASQIRTSGRTGAGSSRFGTKELDSLTHPSSLGRPVPCTDAEESAPAHASDRMTRAGFPPMRTFGSTSWETTAPAASNDPRPTRTPARIVTPAPAQTPSPMVMSRASPGPARRSGPPMA